MLSGAKNPKAPFSTKDSASITLQTPEEAFFYEYSAAKVLVMVKDRKWDAAALQRGSLESPWRLKEDIISFSVS